MHSDDSRPQTKNRRKQLAQLKHHDAQLVAQTSKRSLPSLKQIKFLFRFLTKKESRIFSAAILLVVIGVLWLGIGFIKSNRTSIPDIGGEYSEVITGTPRLINPIFATTNEVDQDLVRLMYSGLMRYDSSGVLMPDLAEEITVSTTVYNIKLRENIFWHDGTPFTADDVIFTILKIQDPNVSSPLRLSFQGVEVEKIDNHNLKMILEEPFAPFLHTLTTGILPQHLWIDTDASSMKLADANIKPIGTGPYKFESLSKNKNGIIIGYTLENNKNFYRGVPFIENLKFYFAPDIASAVETFLSKHADGIHFVPQNKKETIIKRDINLYTLQLPQYTALFFNEKRNAALENDDVRIALEHAIDRGRLIQDGLKGEAQIIYGPILPGKIGYANDANFYEFSPSTSTALLDEAGWEAINRESFVELRTEQLVEEWTEEAEVIVEDEDKDADAADDETSDENNEDEVVDDEMLIDEKTEAEQKLEELQKLAREQIESETPPSQEIFRKNKKDKILTVTITTVNNDATIAAAESIQSFWQAVGVHTILYVIDPQLIQSEIIKNRNYEALLFGEVLGADSDPYPFWHSSQVDDPGLNLSLFVNRKADKLLEEARETNDNEVRAEKYQEFQEILHEEIPAIFLYNPTYNYAQRKKIKDFSASQIVVPADRFNEIEKWFTETKGSWK